MTDNVFSGDTVTMNVRIKPDVQQQDFEVIADTYEEVLRGRDLLSRFLTQGSERLETELQEMAPAQDRKRALEDLLTTMQQVKRELAGTDEATNRLLDEMISKQERLVELERQRVEISNTGAGNVSAPVPITTPIPPSSSTPETPTPDRPAQREESVGGAKSMAAEVIAGLSTQGNQALQSVPQKAGPLGGVVGNLLNMIPNLARGPLAALGVATLGFETAERFANLGQDYTKLTGGTSVGEAVGYEAQARMMALSPFIDSEQARQIVQGTLREGYDGKQANTVMEFVAQNVKSGVMDIDDSFKIYKEVVKEAGGSTETVATQLEILRETAEKSGGSLQDMTKAFQAHVGTYTSMGMGGNAAAQMAGTYTQIFADVPGLEGWAPDFNNMILRQQYAQQSGIGLGDVTAQMAMVGEQPGGAMSIAKGGLKAARQTLLRTYSWLKPGMTKLQILDSPMFDVPGMAPQLLAYIGIPATDDDSAADIIFKLLNEKPKDMIESSVERFREQYQSRSLGEDESARDYLGKNVDASIGPFSEARSHEGQVLYGYERMLNEGMDTLPLLDKLISSDTDLSNTIVEMPDGTRMSIRDAMENNPEQFHKLFSNGRIKYATGKDDAQTEKYLSGQSGKKGAFKTALSRMNEEGVPSAAVTGGAVTISLDSYARKFFKAVEKEDLMGVVKVAENEG